jgi:hypothetical protein
MGDCFGTPALVGGARETASQRHINGIVNFRIETKEINMFKKLSTGYKIASPGLVMTLIFFFMPWVLQSCGTAPKRSYSGFQLAVGTGQGEGYKGNLLVLLSLVAIFVILILLIRSAQRASLTVWDTYGVLVTSVAVLLILFQQFLTPPAKGVNRELLFGLWGFIVGWLLILIGGVINTVEKYSGNRQR